MVNDENKPRFEFTYETEDIDDLAYVLIDGLFDVALMRTPEGLVVDVYPRDGTNPVATMTVWNEDLEPEPPEIVGDSGAEFAPVPEMCGLSAPESQPIPAAQPDRAALLLEALERAIHELELWQLGNIKDEGTETAIRIGKAAIDQAKAEGITAIDAHDLLADRGQIASIWSIDDILSIRPDLNQEQAWEVLLFAEKQHDANIGINWEVLGLHASHLFGDANGGEA